MSAYDAEQIRNIKVHIEMQIDKGLQEEIGLPGRDPHMQVLRICGALNDAIKELRTALLMCDPFMQDKHPYNNAVREALASTEPGTREEGA